jgi:hypothetical protein
VAKLHATPGIWHRSPDSDFAAMGRALASDM